MKYRINPDDRARFKRCRRQWDFASPNRRDLEAVDAVEAAVPTALRDALAVYYYPGTWDWQHHVKQALVHKAFDRSMADTGSTGGLEDYERLLDCYDAWAGTLDDFAPVRVNHDTDALVSDPDHPDRGLLTGDGRPVFYACLIDLLVIDAADEYWVVCHQIVDDWQETSTLIRDEETVTACWACEQDYLGLAIAGTIHNELRVGGPMEFPPVTRLATTADKRITQSGPSGGGRGVPQIRDPAEPSATDRPGRVWQRTAGVLRRTRIRRGRNEILAAGSLLTAEAVDMTRDPAVYPSPAAHCQSCEYYLPCLAVVEGVDPEPVLEARFRRRGPEADPKPRLGRATWGFGRGAAPPNW